MFDPDSDNDDCNDIMKQILQVYQTLKEMMITTVSTGEQTFDNGKINDRGLVKVHFDVDMMLIQKRF